MTKRKYSLYNMYVQYMLDMDCHFAKFLPSYFPFRGKLVWGPGEWVLWFRLHYNTNMSSDSLPPWFQSLLFDCIPNTVTQINPGFKGYNNRLCTLHWPGDLLSKVLIVVL